MLQPNKQYETLLTLQRMRALLSDPKRWTQGAPARDEADGRVLPGDTHATKWCLLGALIKIRGLKWEGCYLDMNKQGAWRALRQTLGSNRPGIFEPYEFNDHNSHRVVLNLLDQTIAAEESRVTEKP